MTGGFYCHHLRDAIKKIGAVVSGLLTGISLTAQTSSIVWPQVETNSYDTLTKGFAQGWAFDDDSAFIFGTSAISRYNLEKWQVEAWNRTPFSGLTNYNHLGAGNYFGGKLYVAMENWGGCGAVTNQSIGVFTADLRRVSVTVVSNYQNEISAVTVAPDLGAQGMVFTASFCDGAHLFEYALPGLNYVRTLALSKPIPSIQGIGYRHGFLFVDADKGQNGLIYAVNPATGETRLIATLTVPGAREYEGLDVSQGDLRIEEGATTRLYLYKFKN